MVIIHELESTLFDSLTDIFHGRIVEVDSGANDGKVERVVIDCELIVTTNSIDILGKKRYTHCALVKDDEHLVVPLFEGTYDAIVPL